MNLYVDRRVVIGFGASLVILLILGFLSYRNNQQFIETRLSIFNSTMVLNHIEQTQTAATRCDDIVAKYIISRDTGFVKRYDAEISIATGHYRKLRELKQDDSHFQTLMDSFRTIGSRKLAVQSSILRDSAHAEELIMGPDMRKATAGVNTVLEMMRDGENRLLQSKVKTSTRNIENFQATFFLLMLAIMLILVAVFFVVNASFKAKVIAEGKTKQINTELEAFTYSVSHDLRSPLRSIRGFTEVLKDEYGAKLDEEGNRLLRIVMKNASHMGQLIDDLLDFSRLGRKKLSYTRIQSRAMVTEIVQELTMHERRVVNWDVKPLEDMRGDASMIKLVWTNLISNALKYSRKKEDAKIEIGSYVEKGTNIFYVRDNGVGFDMQYSNKLFKVFQRLHNNTEFEGTGVGLALVHRIITKHNGKIWADSKPNEGATFSFMLNNPTL